MGTLDGKVAIVTGAGKGIGRLEAKVLAQEGASVTVLARTLKDVELVVAQIKEAGGKAIAVQCDVAKRADVKNAVRATVEAFGTVDILINNAQVYYPPHGVEDWTEEECRTCWETGFLGSFLFMQECFPYMKAKQYGRIINTTSLGGHGIYPGVVGYGANKEAIRSLTRFGAREWGKYNITVNTISPVVLSETLERIFPDEASQRKMCEDLRLPLTRMTTEDEVARVVAFLVGPHSGYMTGNTVGIDGGGGML